MRKRFVNLILLSLIIALLLPATALGFVADPPESNRNNLVDKDVIISPWDSIINPLRKSSSIIKIAGIWDVLAQDKPGGSYSKIGTDLPIKQLFLSSMRDKYGIADFYNFVSYSNGLSWADELILKQPEYNYSYNGKNGISESHGDNKSYVQENMNKLALTLTYQGKYESRMYLRSFVELCGATLANYEADFDKKTNNWGATGRIWVNKFNMPSAKVSMPATAGTKNGLPVLYTDQDYEISLHGYTYVVYTPTTVKALNLAGSQFVKMSYRLTDANNRDYGIGMSSWGNSEYTDYMMLKVKINAGDLAPGKYAIHLWVKDYAERWIRYTQWFYVEDRTHDEEKESVKKSGNIDADFDITIYDESGKLVPNFSTKRAKTGDTIYAENKSKDTNWMYTNVYDVEKTKTYSVAVSPPPSTESREINYNVQEKEDPEDAKMYVPKWYLPGAYTSIVPYEQLENISFKAVEVDNSDSGRSYYYRLRPYRYEDHGSYKTYKSSRWVKHTKVDENGNKTVSYEKKTTTHNIWSSNTVWQRYDNSQYVSYGEITPSKYITKQFADDKWDMESYPYYVMRIAMTITDYYTKTPTPYVETNYGYCSKPVIVYHNNKPVAYFTVPSATSARRDPIHISDFSYDVDGDPVVKEVWKIVETGATFSSASETEKYINNNLVNKPGKYTIRLTVLDDPTDRYDRLEARWSEPFERVIEVKGQEPEYVSYKANIIFDRQYVYTEWHKDAELNIIVQVQDIGYWTREILEGGGVTWRFRPLRLTDVKEPYHLIVRYNDKTMSVYPVEWKVIDTGYNNFELTAKFKYPKAGKPISELVIPFEAEWAGVVDTLRWKVPVNAFNPTFFSDIEQKDRTKFYPIEGLSGLRATVDRQIKQ